jgi:uncharacterized alpha-E superfamily protein
MLSRVAENLYWISRYVERAENVARLLDDAYHLDLGAGLAGADGGPKALEGIIPILACDGPHPAGGREALLEFLTFDVAGTQSIRSMIARARENARGTQETLSSEAWSQLNRLHLYLGGARAPQQLQASPFRFCERVRRECLLFAALVDTTLPRTEVYHFLQVGRYLERVDMMSRILNVHIRPAAATFDNGDTAGWVSLLRCCSAYEPYLRQYQERVEPASVVRFLVLEGDFPRAMRYCVGRCLRSLRAIAGDGTESAAERQLGRLDSDLRYVDVAEVFARGVGAFLTGVKDACNRVGQEIQQAYFLT